MYVADYLRERDHFRELARIHFANTQPDVPELAGLANDMVARFALDLRGRDVGQLPRGSQIIDLVVSFTRTHFIASELVTSAELIEAATLTRKQIELVARLNELTHLEVSSDLEGRTPNVKHVAPGIRRGYSELSGIAHSATAFQLQLLGRSEVDGQHYTLLYPEFHDNAYVAAEQLVQVVAQYATWARLDFPAAAIDYDTTWLDHWIQRLYLARPWFFE